MKVIVPETVCKQDTGIKIIHKLQVGVSVNLTFEVMFSTAGVIHKRGAL